MRRILTGVAIVALMMGGLPAIAQTQDGASPYGAPVQGTPYSPAPGAAPYATPPAGAQPYVPTPAPSPAYAPAPSAAQTLYSVRDVNVRSGPATSYPVIGHVPPGRAVQITGGVPGNPHWVALTTGGFVSASVLSPTPVIVRHHHYYDPAYVPAPPVNYPVGSCQPYTRSIEVGGVPQQVNGTACKQPDGTWKIVTNNAATPVIVQQPPVVVQQPVVPALPPPPAYYYR